MGRTGQSQDTAQSATMTANQKAAFDTGQQEVGQFNANVAKLEAGQDVAPNPWQSAPYLSNVNRLQSGALNANKGAVDQELAALNRRTGGMNNTAAYGAIRDTGLQTARLADQLSAERAAQDFNKNVEYQVGMAQLPLAGASAEEQYYGTSVGGTSAANNALTQLGVASYGPWNSLIQGATQGAGMGAGLAAGCWIAEAIYGEDDWRTHLLRSWLNDEFKRTLFGRAVMAFYLKFGQRIAQLVRRNRFVQAMLRPLFEIALAHAIEDRRQEAF